jgi:acetyl-CoA carboxylase biotin carboxyl carrier protein
MKLEDILTLIKAVSDSDLTEVKIDFEDEKEDLTFTASKAGKGELGNCAPQPVFQQRTSLVPPPLPSMREEYPTMFTSLGKEEASKDGEYITSPMVGTFYDAPGEGEEPFVTVGDTIKKGQVVGIIEAMKLMNEVEATCDGVVEKILVENKKIVGFGDELMLIRTK